MKTTYEPRSLDYFAIKGIAENILYENDITSPPVPIKDIIEKSGLKVFFVKFNSMADEVAGFTVFKDKKIFVNADDHLNRQTFTMAHEYGHWILHKSLFLSHPDEYSVLLRTSHKTSDPLEKEANSFAANILAPEFLLKPVKGIASIPSLAHIFALSEETIKNRLKYVR